MSKQFDIHYCIPPDNQFLIAEIYFCDEHWAELNTEDGTLRLVVFPRTSNAPWMMPFSDASKILREAEQELRKRSIFFEAAR